MRKVALLSCKKIMGFFEPHHPDALPTNIHEKGAAADDLTLFTQDYHDILNAFKKNQLQCELVAWDNVEIDWSQYAAVIIHTPWDYTEHRDAFIKTIKRIEKQSLLLNNVATVEWNSDKHYLQDLKKAGITAIETIFVNVPQNHNIVEYIPKEYYQYGCILKPTISAGSMDVYLIHSPEEAQNIFNTHFKNKHLALMIQPFVKAIKTEGEWSFVFLNGAFSHAVLKKAKEGGFTVKHSRKSKEFVPTENMLRQAKLFYDNLKKYRNDDFLYTRIDVTKDAHQNLSVMEIEQIEPFLYLHLFPGAADRLAEGVIARLK